MNWHKATLACISMVCSACIPDLSELSVGLSRKVDAGRPPEAAPPHVENVGGESVGVEAGRDVAVCLALQEICNGRDDTCDELVDEGCPQSISWTPPVTRRAPLGTSTGGDDFSDQCADDEALVGLTFGVDYWIYQVGGVCRKVALQVDDTRDPYVYSLQYGATRELTIHGTSSAEQKKLVCDDDQVLIGLKIAEQTFDEGVAKIMISEIWIYCGTMRLETTMSGYHVQWSNEVEKGPVAGSRLDAAMAKFTDDRASSPSILIGIHGATGAWLDRLGVSTVEQFRVNVR